MKKPESDTPSNTHKHVQAQRNLNVPFNFNRKRDIEPLTYLCPIQNETWKVWKIYGQKFLIQEDGFIDLLLYFFKKGDNSLIGKMMSCGE